MSGHGHTVRRISLLQLQKCIVDICLLASQVDVMDVYLCVDELIAIECISRVVL